MSQNVPECPNSDNANARPNPAVEPANPAAAHRDPDPPLPANQQSAIALLLSGVHTGDVAAAVGVDRRTLYRWRHHDPRFIRALRHQRAELLDTANDRLRNLLDAALNTLQLQLADPYTPTSHRAAKTLLSLARIGEPAPRRRSTPSQSAIRNSQSAILPTPTAPDYTPAQT